MIDQRPPIAQTSLAGQYSCGTLLHEPRAVPGRAGTDGVAAMTASTHALVRCRTAGPFSPAVSAGTEDEGQQVHDAVPMPDGPGVPAVVRIEGAEP